MKNQALSFIIHLLTAPILAMRQNKLTITTTGAKAPFGGYFRITQNLLANCKHNISSDFGKAPYSTRLAEKASGKN